MEVCNKHAHLYFGINSQNTELDQDFFPIFFQSWNLKRPELTARQIDHAEMHMPGYKKYMKKQKNTVKRSDSMNLASTVYIHTGWATNNTPIKNLNISVRVWAIRLIFFTNHRGMYKIYIHMSKVRENLSQVLLLTSTKK